MIQFNNTHQLPRLIATNRIKALDPEAEVQVLKYPLTNPELGAEATGTAYFVLVDSDVPEAQIEQALSTPITAEETALIADFRGAVGEFNNLPNWATWTPTQARDYVIANILNGQSQAQADTFIDNTATSLAGVRTVLKQIAAALISIRSIMANMAQAILFLRNLVIRVRR